MRRDGFVLPLVLAGGFMLALLVVSFHFVSSSDVRSVARMERSVQAALLADLASDEVSAQIATISLSDPAGTPQWVSDLLDELSAAHANGRPPYAVKNTASVNFTDKVPLTQKAAAKTAATLTLKTIEAKLGPFQSGSEWDAIYRDQLFDPQGKDLKACDLRGPLSIAVTVAGDRGPFEFGQTYLRGQELVLTDTTPLASEFALFSFLPPPSTDYAMTDMQAGGSLVVNPANGPKTSARVLVRGPLVIVPEDAPAPTGKEFLGMPPGDKVPPTPSGDKPVSYPDDAWVGALAAVPGPRVLQHTDAGSITDQALGGIKQAFDGAAEGISARKPENDESLTKIITKPFEFDIVVTLSGGLYAAASTFFTLKGESNRLLGNNQVKAPFGVPQINWQMHDESLVLSNNFNSDTNATFETMDRDPVAYYPPSAFLYAALPAGKQKFRFLSAGPSKTQDYSYCGVRVPYGDSSKEPLKFDRSANIDLKEGDLVTLEPVPRMKDKPAASNVGLIAAYGVALFETRTLVTMPIRDFCMWMMQKFIDTKVPGFLKETAQNNIQTAADQTLQQLHLSTDLTFLIRRFKLQAKYKFDRVDTLEADLRSALGDKSAMLAPYGGYFQDVNFWTTVVPAPIVSGARDALKKPVSQRGAAALRELLPDRNQPDFTPTLSGVDPTWPAGGMPSGETAATKFRDWLTGAYMQDLLRTVMGGSTDSGTTALDNLMRLVKKDPPGVTVPALDVGKRPSGALGDYFTPAPPAVDLKAIEGEYKGGLFPPQYRSFDALITRRYASMVDLANAQTKNGALELKGVALVETMDFSTSFKYRGRGIIVCTSSDPKKPAKLTGTIQAEDPTDPNAPRSMLIVVHRVAPALLAKPGPPQLQLGPSFEGCVYSDSGVAAPAGGTTTIKGNLVCGLLAKHATDGGSTLQVAYDAKRMESLPAKQNQRWTVEMTGEVSSTQPTQP